MIPEHVKTALNEEGKKISLLFPGFYGKIIFNFQNEYVSSTVEQSVRITEPLSEGAINESRN